MTAFFAAVIGASAAIVTQFVAARLRDRSDNRVQRREQLTKLYDPIWVLTNYTKRLQLAIGGDDPEWRLLDSVERVLGDPASALIAHEIVAANQRTATTIFECGGLTRDGAIPPCFLDFLGHAAIVRAAIESGMSPPADKRPHYPHELDEYVRNEVAWLRSELGLPAD